MMPQPLDAIYADRLTDPAAALEVAISAERPRLVALCAKLVGSIEVAEDLAQETLYEAWRHRNRLYALEGLAPWLSAIARNVCLRWRSRQGFVAPFSTASAVSMDAPGLDDVPDSSADLEVDLERAELAALLDRALALLPSATRAVLVARYIEDAPHAEIATRLRMSEGAVRMRLRRGKLEMRRVLETDLEAQARAYALEGGAADGTIAASWQETRIWCPVCGQRYLTGRFIHDTGEFELRCQSCNREPAESGIVHTHQTAILGDVTAYKPAFSRIMAWGHSYNRQALAAHTATCVRCGGAMRLYLHMPETLSPRSRQQRGMHLRCEACGDVSYIAYSGLVLWLPEVRRFWRRHPRVHALPPREVEAEGVPAVVTTVESVPDAARLTVVSARDTFEVLHIYGTIETHGPSDPPLLPAAPESAAQ